MKRKDKIMKPRKLKEILQRVQWCDVVLEFVGIYPGERTKLDEYQNVFDSLLGMEPVLSDAQLVIEYENTDLEYRCPFYLAFGRMSPEDEGDTMAFTPWAEWLGRDIVLEPRGRLPDSRIVAVCLYEMTHYGFTEEKIKQEHLALMKCIDELIKKREEGEESDLMNDYIAEMTMKDTLKSLDKWLRWEGIAKDYFGEEASSFEDQFIGDKACPFYENLDRITIKAALKEVACEILSVAKKL